MKISPLPWRRNDRTIFDAHDTMIVHCMTARDAEREECGDGNAALFFAAPQMRTALTVAAELIDEAISTHVYAEDDEIPAGCRYSAGLATIRGALELAGGAVAVTRTPDASALMLAALKAVKAWSEDENEETGDLGAVLVDVAAAIAAAEGQPAPQMPERIALDRIAARLRGEWSDPHGDLESDVAGVIRSLSTAPQTPASQDDADATPRAPTTDAVGLYIRDMLGEGYIDAPAALPLPGCIPEDETRDSIDYVDDTDPSNLRLHMNSGAVFVVRIIREG